jgi:hypothetical protein
MYLAIGGQRHLEVIMSAMRFISSNPDKSVLPRPHCNETQRRYIHGPVRPMHEPGFLERLFRIN